MSNSKYEPESFIDKAKRKFGGEPLIPIGAIVTAAFLIKGIKAFRAGDAVTSQQMMRGRVVAQGLTVLAFCVGAAYGIRPHDKPKNMQEKMDRTNTETV